MGMVTKRDFFEDLSTALDDWTRVAVESTTSPKADLKWTESPVPYQALQHAISSSGIDPSVLHQVFSECFRGFAVSMLTIVDGGTASAEKGRLHLVDSNQASLGEELHQDFVGYLLDSGKMK